MMLVILSIVFIVLLLVPLTISGKTYINLNGAKVYENIGIGIFPKIAFNVGMNEKSGVTFKSNLPAKKRTKKNNLIRKYFDDVNIKVPLDILDKVKIKSIKISGELSLENKQTEALALGVMRCFLCLVGTNNRGFLEKSTINIINPKDRIVCNLDVCITIKIRPIVIFIGVFNILFSNIKANINRRMYK